VRRAVLRYRGDAGADRPGTAGSLRRGMAPPGQRGARPDGTARLRPGLARPTVRASGTRAFRLAAAGAAPGGAHRRPGLTSGGQAAPSAPLGAVGGDPGEPPANGDAPRLLATGLRPGP